MTTTATPLPLSAQPPALRLDDGGVARVGNSRVSLDVVVEQYENGKSAEDIVRAYNSLELADVYATIAYYLQHREAEADALQTKIESEFPRPSRRELLKRHA